MTANTVRIKLCGLRTPHDAEIAASLGVEFIGLVFAERSRRRLTVEEAKRVVSALSPRPAPRQVLVHAGIPAAPWFDRCAAAFDERLAESHPLVVGVFADQPPALVNGVADAAGLDVVQLSGSEPWEQALTIRRPVIKALRVGAGMPPDALVAECEVGTAAACLLDTAVEGEQGGTGQVFDWQVAAGVARQTPCMLAGGLTPLNVAEAIRIVRPWAVDVSSGIESDGVKDEAKMRAFVQAVRAASGVAPAKE
jgi:phosphoribosylanthranilate isomerase